MWHGEGDEATFGTVDQAFLDEPVPGRPKGGGLLPQQRRQKKWTSMLESIKTGDRVTTSGGLRGIVVALKDDCIHLRVPPDNLRLEVTKASVSQLTTADDEVKTK